MAIDFHPLKSRFSLQYFSGKATDDFRLSPLEVGFDESFVHRAGIGDICVRVGYPGLRFRWFHILGPPVEKVIGEPFVIEREWLESFSKGFVIAMLLEFDDGGVFDTLFTCLLYTSPRYGRVARSLFRSVS